MRETAEQALETAGRATQDTVVVAIEGYDATPRHETVLFNMLTGFVVAFALSGSRRWNSRRLVAVRELRLGGRHIHHFVPGILIAFGSGAAALVTANDGSSRRWRSVRGRNRPHLRWAALLLDLRDVYWTREGVLSVQVSCGLAATLGGAILALRMLRRGEERVEAAGLIPAG